MPFDNTCEVCGNPANVVVTDHCRFERDGIVMFTYAPAGHSPRYFCEKHQHQSEEQSVPPTDDENEVFEKFFQKRSQGKGK
ncbi:hypothetical protein I6Y99_004357 [Vibrio parahaemolyticus]|nr:hypothetical protein [Vibrio parahaemolyticus]